jgi:phage N-6-adenine-methyltransferase
MNSNGNISISQAARRRTRGRRNRPSESGPNDDWATPAWLFILLHREFHFTLDAAASLRNAKLPRFHSRQRNGLRQSWVDEVVWLNPPYDKHEVALWVRKAYEQSRLGAIVVALLPARTHADWFHRYCLPYAEVRFVEGWVPFKGRHRSNTQMCLVAIFRPNGTRMLGPSIRVPPRRSPCA